MHDPSTAAASGPAPVTTPLVRAIGMDHVVLKVRDPEVSVRWYSEVLGLVPERLEEWRNKEVLFVSVRLDATTIIDLFEAEPDGVNVDHVALVVDDVDLQAVADSGLVEVVAGPAELWGAQGQGTGLYVKDPDGHVVELRTYATAG
jgi:glyoxylase I family protein